MAGRAVRRRTIDAAFFDTLTNHFIGAFQSGASSLNSFMLPLMTILGAVAWSAATLHLFATSGGKVEVLIGAAVVALSILLHIFIATQVPDVATGMFTWFSEKGAQVGGLPLSSFQSPSTVFTMGFIVGKPILDFLLRVRSWFTTNPVTMILMLIGLVIILWAFVKQTQHIIMTILSFHLALLAAPILLPWALLTQTKALAAANIAWFFTTFGQIFLLSTVLGVGRVLISQITPLLTAGGDPSVFSAGCMAAAAWVLLALADKVVLLSASLGSGLGLGMTGHALVPQAIGTIASGAAQYAMGGMAGAASAALQRVSSMIRNRRQA